VPLSLTLAVDSYGAFGALADGNKFVQDSIVGNSAVDEEQIFVVEPGLNEAI
jgi:hypothetical protein